MSDSDSELDSDEQQLMAFFPDRFVGLRVPSSRSTRHKLIDLDEMRSGLYHAAVKRRRRRLDREATADENDSDADVDDKIKSPPKGAVADKVRTKRAAPGGTRMRSAIRLSAKRSRARILKSPPVPPMDQSTASTLLTGREISWSMTEVLLTEYVSKRVPMVAACISTLRNQVMRQGIRFNRESLELIPSVDFQQYVQQRLVPFCYQCLDAILLLGVVPILYEREERTGQPWPYVPAIGSYVIKRHTVAGAVRLRFYWRNNDLQNASWQRQMLRVRNQHGVEAWVSRRTYEPRALESPEEAGGLYDPTVEIVHGFGYDPTSDGLLGSKVASLLQMVDERARHSHARATGEMNAANPPVFTEYNYAAEKQASKPFQTGYYTSASVPLELTGGGGGEQNVEQLAARTYSRDAAQMEAYAGLLRTHEQVTGGNAAEQFGVRPEEYKSDLGGTAVVQHAFTSDGRPQPWQRQFHVSSSRVLRAGPQSHVATDYVSILSHLDDEVCAVFGVPKTYLLGNTSVRAGTDLIASRLSDEVMTYKKICGDILTHIYNVLFLNDDIRTYLTSEQRRRRRQQQQQPTKSAAGDGVAPVTEEDLFVSEAIGSVQVSFPKNPAERVDELRELYGLGAISRAMLCTEIARRNNIEPSELFLGDDSDAIDTDVQLEMRQMAFGPYADYIKLKHAERMQTRTLDAAAEHDDKAADAALDLVAANAAVAPPPAAGGKAAPTKKKPAVAAAAPTKKKPVTRSSEKSERAATSKEKRDGDDDKNE